MTELSNPSLVYLVRLVDEEMNRLKAEVEDRDAEDPLLCAVEEDLHDCSLVANELQAMYEKAEKTSANMPRYVEPIDS